MSETVPTRPTRPHAYRWLAALPAILMLGGVPFANRVQPYVLGLPFLLFWILLWVVLTSGVMALVYALDQADARHAGGPTPPAAAGGVSPATPGGAAPAGGDVAGGAR